MPDTLIDLVGRLSGGSTDITLAALRGRINNIDSYLQSVGEIRIFIRNSQQFGHQSSSVNILRNLIRMGATGPFSIALLNSTEFDYPELEEKIRLLIPQYTVTDQAFTIGKVSVTVTRLNKKLPPAKFAITGGCDLTEDLLRREVLPLLNVPAYVQLQPYGWTKGKNLFIIYPPNADSFTIDLEVDYPASQIVNRGFYLADPEVTPSDRIAINNNPKFAQQGAVAAKVIEAVEKEKFGLCPVYGISTKDRGDPLTSLLNTLAGVVSAQETYDSAKQHAIVIVMARLNDRSILKHINLLGINLGFEDPIGFNASSDFKKWWSDESHGGSDNSRAFRIKVVGSNGAPATLQDVTKAIEDAKKEPNEKRVLVVYQPEMPTVLFNYLYKIATLPPVLEGQNTVELMINLGRPYLKITTDSYNSRYNYPTLPLNSRTDGTEAAASNTIVFDGILHSGPALWADEAQSKTWPPGILPPLYNAYVRNTGKLADYFKSLRVFYHDQLNDKLLRALDLYVNWYAHSGFPAVALSAEDKTPLEKLYATLESAITSEKNLKLLSAVSTGLVNEFFKSVVTDSLFNITAADVEISLDKKTVTLAGSTTALGAGTATIEFTFSSSGDDGIKSAFKAELTGATLALPGAQWLSIGDPSLLIELDQNAPVSVVATLGLTVKAGFEAKLSIQIPSSPGQLLLQADFDEIKPSVTNLFQMIGGINLETMLPPQLSLAAAIELQQLSLAYDYKQNVMDYIGVDIGTPPEKKWDLIPDVAVTGIHMSVLIDKPSDLNNRKTSFVINGDFMIAEKSKVSIEAKVPELRIAGGLAEDSEPLSVAGLIGSYLAPESAERLPAFLKSTEIDALSFSVDKAQGAYSFATGVKTDWPIKVGETIIFKITELGMEINAVTTDIDPDEPAAEDTVPGDAKASSKKSTEITGKFTGSTIILPKSANIGVTVTATYEGKEKGWTFDGRTTTEIELGQLLKDQFNFDPGGQGGKKISSLSLTITTADNSWIFEGIANDWRIDFLDLTFKKVTLKAGYNGKKKNGADEEAVGSAASPIILAAAADPEGYFADIAVETNWLGMNIDASVKFAQNKSPVWGVTLPDFKLHADVSNDNEKKEWVASLGFTDNVTLGAMIETMVSWITGAKFGLEAPWNVLDNISLSGLKLDYNFTTKKVGFTVEIGKIDLGIMWIDGITVNYESGNADKAKNGLMVSLKGSFPWNQGDTSTLGPWDASTPGAAPSPPGGGNKYLDLRLLAVGQHVTVDGLIEENTVAGVIDKLRNLDIPTPPEIPIGGPNQPRFAPESSWFVAFDFGLLKVEEKKDGADASAAAASESGALVPAAGSALAMAAEDPKKAAQYFISLGIVFNDPYLYGLRIALDGPMAKIFAGLDFQIIYQQVSKNVGKYSARLALPAIMRKIQIGVASVTLPTFGIEVYTNGDFQVDLGFPWKEDFSVSFAIEIQAGPFPVLGSAGFYFGKLSSAAIAKVPASTKGWFNPVIVFGFGAQIGLGKSIEMGILKAGFSVTVFGIIEGVIARWLPYGPTPGGDTQQLQDGYYFSLTGTMGLHGRLYGSINFAIISAELNIEISLYVRITFASYEPIPITARASVDVSLTVKINLGLFSISIGLGFKADIEVTFVLSNPMMVDPPWRDSQPIAAMAAPDRLSARGLAKNRSDFPELMASAMAFSAAWDNLRPGQTLQLNGWMMPVLTIAGDSSRSPSEQKICYVVNFFLEGEKPIHAAQSDHPSAHSAAASGVEVVAASAVAHAALERVRAASAMEAGPDKFEALAVRVLQWIIAAGQKANEPRTPDQVDDLVVSDGFLEDALTYLSGEATPIPGAKIEGFLDAQTKVSFALKQDATATGEPVPVVFFPAAPSINLSVPSFAGSEKYEYAFGAFNSTSDGYLTSLAAYFNKLKIQLQESKDNQSPNAQDAPPAGPSIASYVFSDYFVMIARLTIQAMRDGLRNFQLVIDEHTGKTVLEIVDEINKAGELTGDNAFTVGELFTANQKHVVSVAANAGAGKTGLAIAGMKWPAIGGQSFDDIAKETIFGAAFDATALALKNQENSTNIAPGILLSAGAGRLYTTQSADTLTIIKGKLGFSTVEALLAAPEPGILRSKLLLGSRPIVDVPAFRHKVVADDTIQTICVRYGLSIDMLAAANRDVVNFFDSDKDPNLNVPHLVQYKVGALIDEMRRTLALQHVGAQVSRYYLHGLRLPTHFDSNAEQLTPNAAGLFVQSKDGKFAYDPAQDTYGLFALTGQAFPLPEIPKPANSGVNTGFSFSLTRSGAQAWLALGADGTRITFDLKGGDDYTRYDSLRTVARAGYLNTQSRDVAPLDVAKVKPGRYPLSLEIPWQPAVAVTLPQQKSVPSTPRPRLWSLPNELINIPNGTAVHPTMRVLMARTDQARGVTVDETVGNYAFASLITLMVKKLPDTRSSGVTRRTYEIIGAPASEITLLERLLAQSGAWAGSLDQIGLFYRPGATGSDAKGWQSDNPGFSLMGIVQTNLSTETRPPDGASAMAADAPRQYSNLIGEPEAFLRLLWEASITRQGGFYLTYSTWTGIDFQDIEGLPDHAFNDRNEAEVAVFALFNRGSAAGRDLANYMNAVVTNEPFDLSDAALVAEAVRTEVASPRAFTATDTIASYAASYYIGAGVLAEMNADAGFTTGLKVNVVGGVYQVPPNGAAPGGDLALIATHFNTTVDAIKSANAGGASLPITLPPYTAIKLPPIVAASDGNSFRKLSAYYGAPIPKIAAVNLDLAGLFQGVTLTAVTGPLSLATVAKQGVAGMTLVRPAPEVPDKGFDANWGEQYLRQTFGLLGYRVADNPGNHYFNLSAWGLPSGPIAPPDPAHNGDKVQAPRAASPRDMWHFSFAVPFASLFSDGNADERPYAGVGGILQFELAWLDIFGNRILSEFDNARAVERTPLNKQPQITGYTDRLMGVGQWPSVAHAYQIRKDEAKGVPVLDFYLNFDATAYQTAAGEAGKQSLDRAIAAYTLIEQQLSDPARVTITLATSLTPSAIWTIRNGTGPGDGQDLRAWADSILTYLKDRRDGKTPAPPDEYISGLPLDLAKVSTDEIFKLTTTLTLSRDSHLIAGELATVAGVAAAATQLAPYTGPLTTDEQNPLPQRKLTGFATHFAAALGSDSGSGYRIATGSDRDVFTGGGKSPLWVVQLGGRAAGRPISYTIANPGVPAVFAPRPVSNVLKSKTNTPIIPYKTGCVIDVQADADPRSFLSIDLDKWLALTLGYIDELLSPRYASPAEILWARLKATMPDQPWPDALQAVLDAKKLLASNLRSAMIAVYDGEKTDDQQLNDIREAFYQSMLGTISQFYGVKAGVQFKADVNAAIRNDHDWKHVPRVYGDVRMKQLLAKDERNPESAQTPARSSISVSSPKLDLKFNGSPSLPGSPYLSMLVTTTAVDEKKITLNLDYNGQYIEHEIGELPSIPDYRPSSWLSFVEIDQPLPLSADLGQFDVPIVLREFPATPNVVNQQQLEAPDSPCYQRTVGPDLSGSPSALLLGDVVCAKDGSYDPIGAVTRWHYAFDYTLQIHHDQDEIHGTISFNIAASGDAIAQHVPRRDLFDNLAQFVQVYPAVQADLNTFLVPIDVSSSDITALKNAQAALQSAAEMIKWVAETASMSVALDEAVGASSADKSVAFRISEDVFKTDTVGALKITISLAAELPSRVGSPFVESPAAGYTCERVPNGDPKMLIFRYKSADGKYLLAADARTIPGRRFVLPDLNILERQDAQTEIYLTRNADIIPDRTIAEPFIYTTPRVTFENPLHPTLVIGDAINLATIFATDPNQPVTRTLQCHLSLLYEALFSNAGTNSVTMQMSLYYEYSINDGIDPIRLPVFLMPPTSTAILNGGGTDTLADVIVRQVAGWDTWFTTYTPEKAGGTLRFDLTAMSNLTRQPMPILRLTGLYVPLDALSR
jgi:hypothetical protein